MLFWHDSGDFPGPLPHFEVLGRLGFACMHLNDPRLHLGLPSTRLPGAYAQALNLLNPRP